MDELNAVLGVTRAEELPEDIDRLLARIQHELFEVGAELATPDPVARGTRTIGPPHIEALETEIDGFQQTLPPLSQFILPGGTRTAASIHHVRAVCRRAERRLVSLVRYATEPISPLLLAISIAWAISCSSCAGHERPRGPHGRDLDQTREGLTLGLTNPKFAASPIWWVRPLGT